MKKQPNIIYIVCHDLGKHLGCYGAQVESPNLDHFAERGVKFTQAFCNAPACSHFNDADYETVHVGLNHERHPLTNHYQVDGEKVYDYKAKSVDAGNK